MLRINTFNGFALLQDDGSPARELPRRLAAIVVLMAHGGEQGASRERILELLWSGHDPAKARHALTQSIYTLRRALGSESSILGTSQLTLNPEVVSSDLADFAAADRRGDEDALVATYRGPFLDGFFVTGAAELEQWISLRREEFASRVSRTLNHLAARAESDGDLPRAAALWRQRTAIDPLDASVALSLMRVLAESGNVAGAIQQGRIYERLVQQELDLPTDRRVAAYLRDLVEGRVHASVASPTRMPALSASPATSASPEPPPAPTGILQGADSVHPVGVPVDTAPTTPVDSSAAGAFPSMRTTEQPAATLVKRVRRWRAMAVSLGVVVVAVAIAAWTTRRSTGETSVPEVAVLPFRVAGVDGDVSFLGEGMVDLISHALGDGQDSSVVDAGESLRAWRAGGGRPGGALPEDSLLRIARALRARRVVVGAIVGNAERLVINATMEDVKTGRAVARASVTGPIDSLPRLARRVAVQLVALAAGEGEVAAANPSIDVPALRAFLRGREAQRRGDWRPALDAFATAVRVDSTFASAALGMALAADWLEERPSRSRALTLVSARRSALSPRERAQLDAIAGTRYPLPSPAAEQLLAWERAVVLAPDREDVWTELGRRFLHEGAAAGVANPLERARHAIDRALTINPGYFPARRVKLAILVASGDSAGLGHWRQASQEQRAHTHPDPLEDWRIAAGLRDEAALVRLRPAFDTLDSDVLRRIALYGIHDADAMSDGERAVRLLAKRHVSGYAHIDALIAGHAYAVAGGRPKEAATILDILATEPTANGAHLRLHVLDALYAEGDSAAAAEAVRGIDARLTRPLPDSPDALSVYLADLCVVAQWRAWSGDIAAPTRAIALLRDRGNHPYLGVVTPNAIACASLLEAIVAARKRSPRLDESLLYLESLSYAGPTVGDLRQYAPLVIARLRVERGEDSLALASIRRRFYGRDWPRYLGSALLLESEIATRVGDREGARRAVAHFLALRQRVEPMVAKSVDEARGLLTSVEQP